MERLFANVYSSKRVLVTGHTGFKGSWLAFWLSRLGAGVTGYALEPEIEPNHFSLLTPPVQSTIGDIRDQRALTRAIQNARPEIVFHLAAQSLVRRSYREPVQTFASNLMGTVNLFEACREVDSVRAIVNITSDKCYENQEWVWGYRENHPMGGHDPYSASKGCAELVTASWRKSFFNPEQYGKTHQILLASARAGNAIGGGDWGEDRLIPDIIRAIDSGREVVIRNPQATRPWQHVLEPLSGYLLLGQKLLEGKSEFAQSWNFGPSDEQDIPVGNLVKRIKTNWDLFEYDIQPDDNQPHEAALLRLDCSKARGRLCWKPVWNYEMALMKTMNWYKNYYEDGVIQTEQDIDNYLRDATLKHLCWTERQ